MTTPSTSRTDRALDIAAGLMPAGRYDREQRCFRRRPFHGWVAFVAFSPTGHPTAPVLLRGRDISAGGLGLLSGRRFEPGTEGAVLAERAAGEHVVLGATVVYCNRRDEMDYEIGLRFRRERPRVGIDAFRSIDGRLPEVGTRGAARD